MNQKVNFVGRSCQGRYLCYRIFVISDSNIWCFLCRENNGYWQR